LRLLDRFTLGSQEQGLMEESNPRFVRIRQVEEAMDYILTARTTLLVEASEGMDREALEKYDRFGKSYAVLREFRERLLM